MLVKLYGPEPGEGEARYSPPACIAEWGAAAGFSVEHATFGS